MKTIYLKIFLTLTAIYFFFSSGIAQPEFIQHPVTNNFTKGADVIAVDLDKDGDMDIIGVNTHTTAHVAWWRNNGFNEFTKVVILNNINSARSVRAEDVNDDQEIDLVVAVYGADDIIYLENDGNESFTEYVVDSNFVGAHTIDLKDVNNDGNLDILCSGFDFYFHNGEIAWWENDGLSSIGWTKHLISDRFQQSPFIYGEDMDNDDDLDVIACGELNDEILWWENDGNQYFEEHMVDSLIDAIHTVIARDVDLDGDMDILAAACMSSQIAWYENDGNQEFIKQPLGYFAGALWLDAVDLDNDNDRDLFGAPQGATMLAWWENNGSQQFNKHNITSSFTQSFCVVPAMMDNDNDTDLVAIGWQSNKISWFENKLEDPNPYYNPECCVFDYANNRWLISSTGGVADPGYISEVDSDGNISYFATGIVDPLGMSIAEDKLVVSDADFGLRIFDLETAQQVDTIPIPVVGNCDGMTYAGNDQLFVIDTWGRIYRVNLATGHKNMFVSSGLTAWTQDCVYDEVNNRLLAIGYAANAPIQAISLEDSSITNYPTSYSYYDGITIDQFGNVYLASHGGPGRIIKYDSELTGDPEIISTEHDEPAGLHYNKQDNILAVPNFAGSTVDFIQIIITSELQQADDGSQNITVYPNPFSEEINIQFKSNSNSTIQIEIFSSHGEKIYKQKLIPSSNENTFSWDGKGFSENDVSPGIYYIRILQDNNNIIKKIIKH